MQIVLPVQTARTMLGEINMFKPDLNDAVLELHDIARRIEQDRNLGKGQLSDDIRKCADRLQEILNAIL